MRQGVVITFLESVEQGPINQLVFHLLQVLHLVHNFQFFIQVIL